MDNIAEPRGNAMMPDGACFAGCHPKTARRHDNRYMQVAGRMREVDHNARTKANARDRGAERSIVFVCPDSERRNVFVDDAVFRKSFETGVPCNAIGKRKQPFWKFTQPGRFVAAGAVTEAILLDASAPIGFPWFGINVSQ